MEMMDENKCAKECRSRRCAKGRLSWVIAGQQSAPEGLEWFPPSSENRLKYIDLGENDDRPCIFFKRLGWTRSVGINRMDMVDENTCAKGRRSRRGVKGRLSWVMAGHMSAPSGSGMVPSELRKMKRIDLGENDDRPCIFSKRLGWTKRFGIYRMEMINENKGEEGCRRDVKGRLSWVIAGQQSAPMGLEWFPPSSENILKHIDRGENDDRP